jgi:hypothetical protein
LLLINWIACVDLCTAARSTVFVCWLHVYIEAGRRVSLHRHGSVILVPHLTNAFSGGFLFNLYVRIHRGYCNWIFRTLVAASPTLVDESFGELDCLDPNLLQRNARCSVSCSRYNAVAAPNTRHTAIWLPCIHWATTHRANCAADNRTHAFHIGQTQQQA